MHFAPYLDIKVNPELAATEPLCAVAVQTDHVLPGHVRGEGELALAAVHFGQDDLVVRVSDLNMHPDLWTRGSESVSSGIVELDFVVSRHHGLVRNLLNKTFPLRLSDVEVKTWREKKVNSYFELFLRRT